MEKIQDGEQIRILFVDMKINLKMENNFKNEVNKDKNH